MEENDKKLSSVSFDIDLKNEIEELVKDSRCKFSSFRSFVLHYSKIGVEHEKKLLENYAPLSLENIPKGDKK